MSSPLYVGGQAVEAVRWYVGAEDSGVDLSTVTAASVRVQHPDDSVAVWLVDIEAQAVDYLILKHTIAITDLPRAGAYVAVADLTVPGGYVRTVPITMPVLDQYAAN